MVSGDQHFISAQTIFKKLEPLEKTKTEMLVTR
jgi:hypothetical protein